MAVLLDLSDELIILAVSHIRKPSHMLQLALANKRIHRIAIQHLYENLTFHQDDYAPPPSLLDLDDTLSKLDLDDTDAMPPMMPNGFNFPQSHILRLSNMMKCSALPAGQTITRLTIVIAINHECNRLQTLLSLLLPQLSSLKDLTLKSVSDERLTWGCERFSLVAFGAALDATSQTLRSLDVHFTLPSNDGGDDDGDEDGDGWTIGSLRHFSKLEYLAIQTPVLLLDYWTTDFDLPCLDAVLPLGLKRLRLYIDAIKGLRILDVDLISFVRKSLRNPRQTKEVIVQLDAVASCVPEQDAVKVFGGNMESMTEAARAAGLDFKVALDWKGEY